MLADPIQAGATEIGNAAWRGWSWLPEPHDWFVHLGDCLDRWGVSPARVSADAPFRDALRAAAHERAPWLVHPCLSPLLEPRLRTHDAQVRLLVWTALNSGAPAADFGTISLHADCDLFAPGGSFAVSAGEHRISDLVASAPTDDFSPMPDPWGHTLPAFDAVGDLALTAWWGHVPATAHDHDQFRASVSGLLKAQSALQRVLPAAWHWFSAMTRVTIPLRKSEGGQFRSGTMAGIPGLVLVEITDQYLLTLEALIHETAHLHYHFAEIVTPFVAPHHAQHYASPLRRDPRPLRGIFLAYHALTYMCGLYRDWHIATGDPRCREAFDQLERLRHDAGDTMQSAADGLTEAGRDFLARCSAMAAATPAPAPAFTPGMESADG